MSFKPFHDRVLLRFVKQPDMTAGGIFIPDNVKEKPQEAEVVAVGPGGRNSQGDLIPIDLKVGDHVIIGKWAGTEIKIGGEDLLIIKESEIMGALV